MNEMDREALKKIEELRAERDELIVLNDLLHEDVSDRDAEILRLRAYINLIQADREFSVSA